MKANNLKINVFLVCKAAGYLVYKYSLLFRGGGDTIKISQITLPIYAEGGP